MTPVADMFKRMPLAKLVDEQLYDAQRQLLDHAAAAEHHAALADMYRRRVQRLLGSETAEPAPLPDESAAIDLKTGRRLRA
jgi:hypothetical protein